MLDSLKTLLKSSKESKMAPTRHSKLGASSCHRWMKCAGSIALSELAPPKLPSKYAEEGTKAHDLAELWLTGTLPDNSNYPQEMRDNVMIYVNEVLYALNLNEGSKLLVEKTFTLDCIDASMFGTNDACVIDDVANELYVFDLKYGKGIEVQAENNKQLLYYALGATLSIKRDRPFDKIHLVIVQPRIDNCVKKWTVENSTLLDFTIDLNHAVEQTKQDNAKLLSGDHCHFCPAITMCPEIKKQAQVVAKTEFDDMTATSLPDVKTMSLEDAARVASFKKVFKHFIDACEDRVYSALHDGKKVDGFKLVHKRKIRKWSDDRAVLSMLRAYGHKESEVVEKKLLSPAQLEKVLGKAEFKDYDYLIDRANAELTLALSGDKRKEVKLLDAQNEFKD